MESSLLSVLVAEDFIPFRSLICSILASRVNLQVICEVGDGLEAVQKAKELRPDLILLDIGLPTLDGMSAPGEIAKFSKGEIFFGLRNPVVTFFKRALVLGRGGSSVKERASPVL